MMSPSQISSPQGTPQSSNGGKSMDGNHRPPSGMYNRQQPQQMMPQGGMQQGVMPGPGMIMMQPGIDADGNRIMYPVQPGPQMVMVMPPNQPHYYPQQVPGQNMMYQPRGYPMPPQMVQIIGSPTVVSPAQGIASPPQSTGPRSVPYQPQHLYHMQQQQQQQQMQTNGRGGYVQVHPGQPMMQPYPQQQMGGHTTPHGQVKSDYQRPQNNNNNGNNGSNGPPAQGPSTPTNQLQSSPQQQTQQQTQQQQQPQQQQPQQQQLHMGSQPPSIPHTPNSLSPQPVMYRYGQAPPAQQMFIPAQGMIPPHMQGYQPGMRVPMVQTQGLGPGHMSPIPPMQSMPIMISPGQQMSPQTPTSSSSSVSTEPYVPVRAKSKFTVKDKDGNVVDLDEMRRNRESVKTPSVPPVSSSTSAVTADTSDVPSDLTPEPVSTTVAISTDSIEEGTDLIPTAIPVKAKSEEAHRTINTYIDTTITDHIENTVTADITSVDTDAPVTIDSSTNTPSVDDLVDSLSTLAIATESVVSEELLVIEASVNINTETGQAVQPSAVENATVDDCEIQSSSSVNITAQSADSTSTSALASDTINTSTTQQQASFNTEKKGKVSLKKLLATADAKDNSLSMMDAYTITEDIIPVDTGAIDSTATLPEPQPSPDKSATSIDGFNNTDEADPDQDEWSKSVEKVDLKPALRRLTPHGGGKNQARLNSGPGQGNKSKLILYTKEDVIKLKPTSLQEKPTAMQYYPNVNVVDEKTNVSRILPVRGYFQFDFKQGYRDGGGKDDRDRGSGQERGGSSKNFDRSQSYDRSSSVLTQSVEDWKRGDGAQTGPHTPHQYGQQQQHGGYTPGVTQQNQGQRRARVPQPRPQKVITDPTLQLTTEVMQILNKITPQSFEKLTTKLCEIPVPTNALLDKLIELVYEKAIQEQYFANLYADMCAALEDQSRYWSFMQIVFNKDTQQFFWTLDLEFESELAGPFTSVEQCVDVAQSADVVLDFQTVAFKVQVVDLIVASDMLIKVFQQTQAPNEYYFSFIPMADVKPELVSGTTFLTLEAAQKDALKKNSFRRRLVLICQQEFECSTSNTGIYSLLTEYAEWSKTTARKLTADERTQQEAEWEHKKSKLKKRMLGNIRFIGELYKKGMISTKIMHKCIEHLIGKHENGEWVGWKDEPDEQDLEILCKFLPTVGETLDSKASSEGGENVLDWYMGRLHELSKEKSINSRIRFGLEEVIKLRENKWQSRRAQDGPKTIEAIHQKIAEEEQQKALEQQKILQQQQQQGKLSRQNSHTMSRQPSVDSSYINRPSPRETVDNRGDNRGDIRNSRDGRDPRDPRYQPVPEQRFQNVRILGQEGPRGDRPYAGQQQSQQPPSGRRVTVGGSSGKGAPSSGLPPVSGNTQRPVSLQSSRNPSSDNFAQYNASTQGISAEESLSRQPSGISSGSSPSGSIGVASTFPRPSGTEIRKRVKFLIISYFSHGDINEVQLLLVELGIESCGFFIQELVIAYVDCGPKDSKAAKFFGMIPQLESVLVPARLVIEASLGDLELLLKLQDYLCDSPEVSVCIYK